MSSPRIQPYFHPTTVLMVDDNQRFLDNFSLLLDERLACRFFTSASEALQLINAQARATTLDQRCCRYLRQQEAAAGERTLRLDLTLIEREISNTQRFADISVVVVDYDMPEMNGLAFCQQLKHPRVKKVLLTGVADEKLAVDAFNAGTIHHFLTKQDPDLTGKLNRTLEGLQQRYFSDVSTLLQTTLALDPPDFLHDSRFIDYFHRLLRQHDIVEYYYVEDPDGFLLVSTDGQLQRLLVSSEQSLQRALFSLRSLAPPTDVLKQLSGGKALPWLWATPEEFGDEHFDWREFVHPATRVAGEQETWLCALVDSPPADIEYDWQTSSYRAYLDSLDQLRR
ncbi:response regulator [Isoalcanivorax beigongshangi]|uniref:Response regulator n=1 Tax=Isoalcanivorax beigongshangi TaxID=3238810 RepID=A0ABV4AGB1_9GAMM